MCGNGRLEQARHVVATRERLRWGGAGRSVCRETLLRDAGRDPAEPEAPLGSVSLTKARPCGCEGDPELSPRHALSRVGEACPGGGAQLPGRMSCWPSRRAHSRARRWPVAALNDALAAATATGAVTAGLVRVRSRTEASIDAFCWAFPDCTDDAPNRACEAHITD
jgi:hypothetical protein